MKASPGTKSELLLVRDLRRRYLNALVDGDRPAAAAAIEEGFAVGLSTPTFLLEILGPAQQEIGELWHGGEVSVSQEHWATQVTLEQIERVLERRRPAAQLGRRVVVTTVPGEAHTLPARIVAGLLSGRGWWVDFLGEAPPTSDLVDYVRQRQPDLLALSVTLRSGLEEARAVCETLQEMETPRPVLIGGAGSAGRTSGELSATAVAADALEGLQRSAELVGLGSARDLEAYLALVGRRIREFRTAARMNQSELADRSGLARSYLSAVERGRRNITLEAAMKIASALEVGMGELLEEGWR